MALKKVHMTIESINDEALRALIRPFFMISAPIIIRPKVHDA